MSFFKRVYPKILLAVVILLLIVGFLGKRVLNFSRYQETPFPEKGLVTAVYDGDTIRVKFKNRQSKIVRLIGIDAPEMGDSRESIKFYAYMAKRFTFCHLYLQEINLSYDQPLEDKYGRLLAYVWTEREALFNKFMIKKGFAYAFLRFSFRDDYREEFIEAEREARSQGRGLWRKGPSPSISLDELEDHKGTIVSVVFKCHRVYKKGKFFFIRPSGDEFAALIPRERISDFPKVSSLEDKILSVTGYLEEYKGQPQIIIFLPGQIELKEHDSLPNGGIKYTGIRSAEIFFT